MKIHHPCRNVDRKTAEAGYGPWHNNTMLIFDIPYRSSFPHRSGEQRAVYGTVEYLNIGPSDGRGAKLGDFGLGYHSKFVESTVAAFELLVFSKCLANRSRQ